MPRSLSLLVGLAILALAEAARAGPDFRLEFFPFPLTRFYWQEHTLGPDRQVLVEPKGVEPELAWRVDFFSGFRAPFTRSAGVLELRPPERCAPPVLGAPISDHHFGTAGEIEFDTLARMRRVALVNEAGVEALLARFAREFALAARWIPAPERCERIRERCSAGVPATKIEIGATVVYEPGVAYPGFPGAAPLTGCDPIEKSLELCRELGAQKVARSERRREAVRGCRGLVVATPRADGDMALRVIGDDGAEWGRVTVAPEERVRVKAWIMAPLTIPADIVLMGLQATLLALVHLIALIHGIAG